MRTCDKSGMLWGMAKEYPKDTPAAALVQQRWDKTTPEQRSKLAKKLAQARWGKKRAAGKKAAKKKGAKKGL